MPSRESLDAIVAEQVAELEDDVGEAWAAACVEPTRWRVRDRADDVRSWVVAVQGERAVFYDDVEDGFGIAGFQVQGVLDERVGTSDLAGALGWFVERARVGGAPRVPAELAGPGRIVRREGRSWTLVGAATFRVHFLGEKERRAGGPDFARAELVRGHPMLMAYAEPQQEVYFSGGEVVPEDFGARLERELQAAMGGWRTFAGAGAAVRKNRFGRAFGGPASLATIVAEALRAAGASASVIDVPGGRADVRALLLGRNVVVAKGFLFERL
jgi:hypothetical protein